MKPESGYFGRVSAVPLYPNLVQKQFLDKKKNLWKGVHESMMREVAFASSDLPRGILLLANNIVASKSHIATIYEYGGIDLFDCIHQNVVLSDQEFCINAYLMIHMLIELKKRRIIHGDFCLENVTFETNTRTLRWIDFGLSFMETKSSFTPKIHRSFHDVSDHSAPYERDWYAIFRILLIMGTPYNLYFEHSESKTSEFAHGVRTYLDSHPTVHPCKLRILQDLLHQIQNLDQVQLDSIGDRWKEWLQSHDEWKHVESILNVVHESADVRAQHQRQMYSEMESKITPQLESIRQTTLHQLWVYMYSLSQCSFPDCSLEVLHSVRFVFLVMHIWNRWIGLVATNKEAADVWKIVHPKEWGIAIMVYVGALLLKSSDISNVLYRLASLFAPFSEATAEDNKETVQVEWTQQPNTYQSRIQLCTFYLMRCFLRSRCNMLDVWTQQISLTHLLLQFQPVSVLIQYWIQPHFTNTSQDALTDDAIYFLWLKEEWMKLPLQTPKRKRSHEPYLEHECKRPRHE